MPAKIWTFDIETTPNVVWQYDLRSQYTPIDFIIEPQRMACFAGRFRGQKKVEFYSEWGDGQQGMAEAMWAAFDEADAILTFNGKTFDEPWARTVFHKAGLKPPSPVFHIDMYQQTKQFRLPSHKLQYVSTNLVQAGGKVPISLMHAIQDAIAGDVKQQRLVERYNKGDVTVLDAVYDDLVPWLKLPNALLYGAPEGACPRCSSTDVERRGRKALLTGVYQQFWCRSCGGWFRGTQRIDGAGTVL